MATAKRTATAPVHLWCQAWIPAFAGMTWDGAGAHEELEHASIQTDPV